MESRNSEYPAACADADAPARRASPAATVSRLRQPVSHAAGLTDPIAEQVRGPLGIVSPRRIVDVHGEHERKRAADQGLDQRELLVGVVDERRAADAPECVALRQNV